MAQISFRILGNPASSGGYTPLVSKGEPKEADKVEIPYPNYTTDGECYGIKIYQDVVSYALYANPIKVTSFEGNRGAALNIYIYIPKGYIVSFEGQEVSPKHILDRLSEEFYTQFMTMKGGVTSGTWSYKTQRIEEFSESKSLFVNIINEYTLQEKKQRSIVMCGRANANVIVGSDNDIAQLMLDPYYDQLSSYDRLIIIKNGETNIDTLSLTIPRPKTYKVYVNGSYTGQIKSDMQAIITNYQPAHSYKTAENYSFTLQDVKKGKFAGKVTIDDINETVNCIVPEKDKVIEWSFTIRVDGKLAEPAFKEQLWRTMCFESFGITKQIKSDKIKLVGAEIEKEWTLKNYKLEGYDVESDKNGRTIILSYTKKAVAQKTSVSSRPAQSSGSAMSKIVKKDYSIVKFSLNDENNEYSQSDFEGTKLIIEIGNQNIIIPFYLNKGKDNYLFEDVVDVEHFIADKIFNSPIRVKSKSFTFEYKVDRKGETIQLFPKKLPFLNRLKKKRRFKTLITVLLCIISGGMGFYVSNILSHDKKETIQIKDFNSYTEGYLLNGKVYKKDGSIVGYILESNIYRNQNANDEILGIYNHDDRVLTLENTNKNVVQGGTQSDASEKSEIAETKQEVETEPDATQESTTLKSEGDRLEKVAKDWLEKIKDASIKFDEIETCKEWADKNPSAPNAEKIADYCNKIGMVREFLQSLANKGTVDIIKKAKDLNGKCQGDDLKQYRVILQKYYLQKEDETDDQYKERINKLIIETQDKKISSFDQIKNK